MLRIVSANLNGIRSAHQKGFFDWLAGVGADFVCVQELKAQACDLSECMLNPGGMIGYFHYAEKKGYSGVGVYTRHQPDDVVEGLGVDWINAEGRVLQLNFGKLSVISLYLPSGASSEERQKMKFDFLEAFMPHLEMLYASGRDIVICGDWNIAHNEIDLKNWKNNLKRSGFLQEERAWMTDLLGRVGWCDAWRRLYPNMPGYTWWSNRGQAYANDVGWRIDYHILTPSLMFLARGAWIYKNVKFSDHAPLIVDYERTL